MLKAAIVLLMLALVASLGSGFYYLMLDQGDKEKRRIFHSLGVRLSIAAVLMALVIYSVASGQLGHSNPWDGGIKPPTSQESSSSTKGDPPALPGRHPKFDNPGSPIGTPAHER